MAEYLTTDAVQAVALNTAIPFIDSIPCNKGYVYHQSGTGIFVLRGIVNNSSCCFAQNDTVSFRGSSSKEPVISLPLSEQFFLHYALQPDT